MRTRNIRNLIKTSRVRLVLFIAPFGLLFFWLIVVLVRRWWGIRGEPLNTAQTLSLLEVIVGCAALTMAFPAVVVVISDLRAMIARPELVPQFIVRFRPEDQATEPCYYVEVSLYNSSDVTAHHFRFLCYCYTPTNPGDPRGQPWPVNVKQSSTLPAAPCPIDVDNYATVLKLLPTKNLPGKSLVRGWELRASELYAYPKDRLHIATIEVFGPDLSLDWRLDSEGSVKKGSQECARPTG